MIDREKVLNGIECLADENAACHSDCPYFADREDGGFCFRKMARDALDLLKEQPQWISVKEKDKLPEMHMTYRYDGDPPEEVPSGICKSKIVQIAILCKESGEPEYFIERGYLRDGEWWACNGFYESQIPFEVTHWMPLPEPPEGVKQAE